MSEDGWSFPRMIRCQGPSITDDIYCFAMSEGIIQANTADLARHPDLSGQMHKRIASPWRCAYAADEYAENRTIPTGPEVGGL